MAPCGLPPVLDGVDLEHHWVATNGVHLHVVEAGPSAGPLMLLLPGFPESWYGWRSQIPALARARYRVWAPDGRGYGLSDKPPSVYAQSGAAAAERLLRLLPAAPAARGAPARGRSSGARAEPPGFEQAGNLLGRLEAFDEATHWLQHEEPEAVNRSILAFLAR